jgi:hypothetical protein
VAVTDAWFADTETLRPRAVTCAELKAFVRDSDGRTICVNTHFATEAEAWDKVLREAAAGLSLSASEVRECRARLERAEKATVDAALARDSAERAFADWKAGASLGSLLTEPAVGPAQATDAQYFEAWGLRRCDSTSHLYEKRQPIDADQHCHFCGITPAIDAACLRHLRAKGGR